MTGLAMDIEDRGLSNKGGNGLSPEGDVVFKAVSDLESLGENPLCVKRGLPSSIGVGGGDVEAADGPGMGSGVETVVGFCVVSRKEFSLPADNC
jgi:hypothetical protein